jgi:hypothetical protein
MSLITATWEAEVGGSWFKANLGKRKKSYLEKKPKVERAGIRIVAEGTERRTFLAGVTVSSIPRTAKNKKIYMLIRK